MVPEMNPAAKPMHVKNKTRIIFALILLYSGCALTSCGYSFRTSYSPVLEREGISTVYAAPFKNDSSYPEASVLVFNAVTQRLAASGMVRFVSDPKVADVVLTGAVSQAKLEARSDSGTAVLEPEFEECRN